MIQPRHKRAGIAILSVVVVLSTLLIIGVLFAMTVELDLKANRYYREAGKTEMIALEGLYRAIGEIQYDQWGVNEDRSFKLANHGKFDPGDGIVKHVGLKTRDELEADGDDLAQPPGTPGAAPAGARGVESAYYRTARNRFFVRDPANLDYDNTDAIVRPISKWRQSVEEIDGKKVLTDFRWLWETPRGSVYATDDPDTRKYIHSGAMYHDEFLPEGVDNFDAWELGLHVNNGDLFYDFKPFGSGGQPVAERSRAYHTDNEGLLATTTGVYGGKYWITDRGNVKPWDVEFDYIDTRINGDSFYKIFRSELVYWDEELDAANGVIAAGADAPSPWRSNAAGVIDRINPLGAGHPIPRNPASRDQSLWLDQRTHLGDSAAGSSDYTGYNGGGDSRGGAVNINPVNNNYRWEAYGARDEFGDYQSFHYRDAKWIYVYNESGTKKTGRYAVTVLPESGSPSVNYHYDTTTFSGATNYGAAQRMTDFLLLLDSGFNPRGGPLSLSLLPAGDPLTGANFIKSNVVPSRAGYTVPTRGFGTHWAHRISKRIADHVTDTGAITSRAELHMLIRKDGFALPTTTEPGLSPEQQRSKDADLICAWETVHGYQNLMGPHWEHDRIILDALGFNYAADKDFKGIGVSPVTEWVKTSFVAAGADGEATRETIWHTLDNLRFYWGPVDDLEGKLTPYSEGYSDDSRYPSLHPLQSLPDKHLPPDAPSPLPASTYRTEEAATVKSKFLSWVAGGMFASASKGTGRVPYGTRNLMSGNTHIGWAFDASEPGSTAASANFVGSGLGAIPAAPRDPRIADISGASPSLKRDTTLTWSWPLQINEVGSLDGAALSTLKGALVSQNAPGAARVNLAAYYFVEFIHQGQQYCSASVWPNFLSDVGINGNGTLNPNSSNTKLHVLSGGSVSSDILADPGTVIIYADRTNPSGLELNLAVCKRETCDARTPRVDGGQSTDARCISLNHYSTDGAISHANYLPGNYMLVLFPQTAAYDGSKIVLTVPATGGTDRIVDFVELPGDLSQGYSCYDPFNNQHPAQWALTGNNILENDVSNNLATPAWRFDGTWRHGLNANFFTTYIPGFESYDPGYAVLDNDENTKDVAGLFGKDVGDASWVAVGIVSYVQKLRITNVGNHWMPLDNRGRWGSMPVGFFPKGPSRPELRGDTSFANPFLFTWRDFMDVAPAERYFTTGYLDMDIRMHGEYSIYDGFDNNQDGLVDDMVADARIGVDWDDARYASTDNFEIYKAAKHSKGHYVGDRGVVGGINLNEIAHPGVLWYSGISQIMGSGWRTFDAQAIWTEFAHHMVLIGRKPLKGYNSWKHFNTRSGNVYGSRIKTGANSFIADLDTIDGLPYHAAVWYENLFADGDSMHVNINKGFALGHEQHEMRSTGRVLWVGNSPVFTIYCTAQSLDDFELPLAEIKVMATIERSWDGKLNMLDFKWMPSAVRK